MSLTQRARKLRTNQTEAEKLLWRRLRNRQIESFKFYRQFPVYPYFVDFLCREPKLVIELDGGQHAASLKDVRRSAFLESKGYKVLRFWNNEVMQNMDGVLLEIQAVLQSLAPALSLKGEGEEAA